MGGIEPPALLLDSDNLTNYSPALAWGAIDTSLHRNATLIHTHKLLVVMVWLHC